MLVALTALACESTPSPPSMTAAASQRPSLQAAPTEAQVTPSSGPTTQPGSSPATSPGPTATEPPGPGAETLTVAQARAISADRPLRIRASIVIDTSRVPAVVQLCDAMSRSLPPQCVGDAVFVTGISLEKLSGRAQYQQRGPIAWSDSIELVGRLRADVFTVME